MNQHDPIVGRYVYVQCEGKTYRTYYEENGEGIPLVCLHTAGTDGRQYRHQLCDPDITQNFRVIAFDLWRMCDRVKWWDEYVDPTPVVFGHYWRGSAGDEDVSGGKPDLFDGYQSNQWAGSTQESLLRRLLRRWPISRAPPQRRVIRNTTRRRSLAGARDRLRLRLDVT